jgi:hypothetical protein
MPSIGANMVNNGKFRIVEGHLSLMKPTSDEELIVLIGHKIKMLTTQNRIWMLGGHNSSCVGHSVTASYIVGLTISLPTPAVKRRVS